jgi:hypothetical protein
MGRDGMMREVATTAFLIGHEYRTVRDMPPGAGCNHEVKCAYLEFG